MSLANIWTPYSYKSASILTPNDDYECQAEETLDVISSYGFDIPKHTTIIFPEKFSDKESPVSYPHMKCVFLFPTQVRGTLMFQYLHELGHIFLGNLPQEHKWLGELIACSCSYFFYPKNTNYFINSLLPTVLSFKENQANFNCIREKLPKEQYLVYKGSHKIESALWAYNLFNNNFNFFDYLKEIILNPQLLWDEEYPFHPELLLEQ